MARSNYSRQPTGGSTSQQISYAITLAIILICVAYRAYNPTIPQPRSTHSSRSSRQPAWSLPSNSSPASAASNLLLGNPSNAGTDANNYLLVKPYFVISYNNEKGDPNWVSWRIVADDLGEAPRRRDFATDETLPPEMKHITDHDYTGGGFDRGHMCPHGDRTKNTDMSYATFIMTNVIPQAHNLNEKAWDELEAYCRDLAKFDHDRVYVIDGSAGQGGTGLFGKVNTIANGQVVVPAVCWKVIVAVPDDGTEDLSDITANTRVIAVIMPNDQNVGFEWDQFRVSVAEIEKLTGYHFFTALPPSVAAALRAKVDRVPIDPPKPQEHYERSKPRSNVPGDFN